MKFSKYILPFFLTCITISGCQHKKNSTSDIKAQGNAVGQFRGYEKINLLFRDKIYNTPNGFSILSTVGLPPQDVFPLLGTYQGFGARNSFKNSDPNGINMFLWQVIFQRLTSNLSDICLIDSNNGVMNQTYFDLMKNFCEKHDKESAVELWTYLVGFESDEEFEGVWTEFSKIPFSTKSAYTADFLYVTFLNPHFLLEK